MYQRLVLESPENPPDLVIGADTIVVRCPTHCDLLVSPNLTSPLNPGSPRSE